MKQNRQISMHGPLNRNDMEFTPSTSGREAECATCRRDVLVEDESASERMLTMPSLKRDVGVPEKKPRPADPPAVSGTLRMLQMAVAFLFVCAGVYLVYCWFMPAPELRAFIEMPETSMTSPIDGVVDVRVRTGQKVDKNDLLAVVRIAPAEQERRQQEIIQLQTEIQALETCRAETVERVETLRQARIKSLQAQRNMQLAQLDYESTRDQSYTNLESGMLISSQASDWTRQLSLHMDSLQTKGVAAPVESIDARIRDLDHRILTDALYRDQERYRQQRAKVETWRSSQNQCSDVALTVPSDEEVRDYRLLDELKLAHDTKTSRMDVLKQAVAEYTLRADRAGTVTAVTSATQVRSADNVVSITDPEQASIVIRSPYTLYHKKYVPAGTVRFRLKRNLVRGEATLLNVRKGVTEQDRTLNRVEYVEHVARPNMRMNDLVPGESVELDW